MECEPPKKFLETSDDDSWIPCMMCGGTITQVRKALFTCLDCSAQYAADEKDMRKD